MVVGMTLRRVNTVAEFWAITQQTRGNILRNAILQSKDQIKAYSNFVVYLVTFEKGAYNKEREMKFIVWYRADQVGPILYFGLPDNPNKKTTQMLLDGKLLEKLTQSQCNGHPLVESARRVQRSWLEL